MNMHTIDTASSREWSAFQLAIFADVAEGKGHTVVLARAGSGKTSTIVSALEHTPHGKTALMVAFNKSIATELERRAPGHVEVSTLHAFGFKALGRAYGRLTVDKNRVAELAKAAYGAEVYTFPIRKALERVVSLMKSTLIPMDPFRVDELIDSHGIDSAPVEPEARTEFVTHAISILEKCKDVSQGRIDFDDMVWLPVVLKLKVQKFDMVFVDETQDLNAAQVELALMASKKTGRIIAVGDDRQAIYAFRGAAQDSVSRLIKRLDAKVLPLSISYRCAKSIVGVAKRMVPDFDHAPNAPEGEVAEMDLTMMQRSVRDGDFILSRTNAPLVPLCLSFIREGRRATIQGRDLGASLATFVKNAEKAGVDSVPDLVTYTEEWMHKEVERLLGREPPRDTTQVEDRAMTIIAITDGCRSIAEVIARIEGLFSDGDDTTRIVLSTTHKAKGLERDRAFILSETYRKRPGLEEENLYYVAVTRARKSLFLVHR